MIPRILLLVILSTVIGAANFFLNPRAPQYGEEITFSEIPRLPAPVIFVDARKAEEYAQGHIAGAISLPEDDFDGHVGAFLDAWDMNGSIVVYCKADSCNLSAAVARRLREDFQMKNIYVLVEDWDLWPRHLK